MNRRACTTRPRAREVAWLWCVPIALVLLGCHGEDARVQVTYFMRSGLPAASFRTTIDDGSGRREFRGASLTANASQVATPMVDTRRSGTLRVAFALDAEGGAASQGEVSLPLRSDWTWGIWVQIDSIDPRRTCFGCIDSRAFPLIDRYRRVAADSVWVTWGGNSIKNPVIY
jgi:hypothetical protein